MRYTVIATALAATVQAAQNERTFAVLRFYGDGPMMQGRVDPVITPGKTSTHVHTIQGGSNFGISATGQDLMNSNCSSALIEGDNSAYWVPQVWFSDKSTGMVEPVSMYYMNVYYFFEPTDDDIKAFPVGLQMVSGNASMRDCPNFGGLSQLDAGNSSGIQPLQWTCPRSAYQPASWASASVSDGMKEGIQDPTNEQAGQGFPFAQCDGEYSPLRQDLHFPSCYDPSKELTDYENNMVFPTSVYKDGGWKQNCPEGWIHVPHLFYEMYWNTIDFQSRWTPNQGDQPFVLSNGDLSGCSGHGDFMAAWDTTVLQHIIDTCNAGDPGMIYCPGITVRDQTTSCNVASPINEVITGNMTALPGSNPLKGWGMSEGQSNPATSAAAGSSSASPTTAATSSSTSASTSPSASTSAHVVSPAESGSDTGSMPSSAVSLASSASTAAQDTASTTVAAEENVATALTTTSVTTLPNGHVVTTTVVDWVTVTQWVTQDVPAATVTVHAKKDVHAHAHAREHLFRHRSPHH